ncbi:MAG: response regulator [Sandaracinaceae bacterium]|nr:MAG: response regulator [Sandaracinaceae bacterium]
MSGWRRWLSPEVRSDDPELVTGARRAAGLFAIVAIAWLAFAVQYAAQGRWVTVCIDVVVVAATVALRAWTLRAPSSKRVAVGTSLVTLVSAVGLLAASILSGQDRAMAVWFIALAPLFLGYVVGPGSALGAAVLSSVFIGAVYASSSITTVEPEFVAEGSERMLGQILFAWIVAAFAWTARKAMDTQVDTIERQRALAVRAAAALETARDRALAADRAKSEFLANVSHELRTPLTAILGMADLLADDPLGATQETRVERIREAGRTLLALLDDVLDLSAVEADRLALSPETFGLRRELDRVAEMLAPKAAAGVAVRADIGPDVPEWVRVDGRRLRQVLVNLVGNAVKFTAEGHVVVRARAEGDRVRFEVEDTGIGIPADARERIFEPFQQVDASTSRRFGGTGLGLAISARLVRSLGGDLEVDSEDGRGSIFHFTLDLPRAAAAPELVRPSIPDARIAETHPLSILVAEDNEVNREVIGALLERLGYTPVITENGVEALAAMKRAHFDVALVDIQMPLMDGLGVAREVGTRPDGPTLVALTANAMAHQRQRYLDAGFAQVLPKPIDPSGLARALEALHDGRDLVAADPSSGVTESFDEGRLEPLEKISGDRFPTLLASHLENGGALVEAAREALSAGDLEGVERASHSLKSSSAQFGSMRVSDACAALERAAAEGRRGDAEATLSALEAAWERAAGRLRERITAA